MDTRARKLPPRDRMLEAFLRRDPEWDGLFYTGVVTTGVFCRPTCAARKPRAGNVRFFPTAGEALVAGFRPCRRCRPMEPAGATPDWLRRLVEAVEEDPGRRWRDADLRGMGLHPERVRRWFQRRHGMTFHAYCRARRVGLALSDLQNGRGVLTAGMERGWQSASGFQDAVRRSLGQAPRAAASERVVRLERVTTPVGTLLAGATDEALCLLEFADRRQLETQLERLGRRLRCRFLAARNDVISATEHQLDEYFQGRRKRFEVPLELDGTKFQSTVWRALLEIPYGETASYAELAARIGRPTSVRAVARANGDNRIPIIVPCHRVIGADGRLTGYGGGLWRKRRLLELERTKR